MEKSHKDIPKFVIDSNIWKRSRRASNDFDEEAWDEFVEQIRSDPSNKMTLEDNDKMFAEMRAEKEAHIKKIGLEAWAKELDALEDDEREA